MFTMQDVMREADIILSPGNRIKYADEVHGRIVLGIDCYVLDKNGFEVLVPFHQPVDISDSPTIQVTGWASGGTEGVDLRFEAHVLNPVGHVLREKQA